MTTTVSQLADLELRTCEREPIRIPGSIQPHGVLLVLEPGSLRCWQVSRNISDHFGVAPELALQKGLTSLFPEEEATHLINSLGQARLTNNPTYMGTLQHAKSRYYALAHQYQGMLLVEFEPVAIGSPYFRELYQTVGTFVSRLGGLGDALEVARIAAGQVRELTGFDRVLVYQFDADWNGTVIAEARNEKLPSYLDLRFPASDIPSQARELYRLNPTRVIPDATYVPSPLQPELNPLTGQPVDLSFAGLRSVSPIHREYMVNMGTASSMSISILRHGELWGLISCHNKEARRVSFDVRKACEFIGQVISVQTEAHERNAIFSERVRLKTTESQLLAHMAQHDNFVDGLASAEDALLDFAAAEGAAVLHNGVHAAVGVTPGREAIDAIVKWLAKNAPFEDVFHSDHFGDLLAFDNPRDQVAGLLAVRISKLHNSYVLWFRPEFIQTVKWGGDPSKPADESARIHPRHSFELWKETVRDKSRAFTASEIEAAVELRNAIVGVVLRKAEEMAELTSQLRRSNQELEAFSYSVSHDLRAPFRHIVGYSELLREREADHLTSEGLRYVDNIVESAEFAGTLVDNLLNFSRMARASLSMLRVSLRDLVEEVRRETHAENRDRQIEWKVAPLPTVVADPIFLRLVLRNLFSNAAKYSRTREVSQIEVSGRSTEYEHIICVRDNGVGFDMRYVDKLFGVFQRLHRIEEFEGTGIGLANVRRIIERHGGRTWAESELGKGAAFYFALPARIHNADQ